MDGHSTAVPQWGISMNRSGECCVGPVKLAEDKESSWPAAPTRPGVNDLSFTRYLPVDTSEGFGAPAQIVGRFYTCSSRAHNVAAEIC